MVGIVVIDFHTHISKKGFTPNEVIRMSVEGLAVQTGVAPEKVMRDLENHPTLYNSPPESLVKDMDDAGIDKSVLIANDYGLVPEFSKPKISIEEYNKWVADAAATYPDRLLAFVGVDLEEKTLWKSWRKAFKSGA